MAHFLEVSSQNQVQSKLLQVYNTFRDAPLIESMYLTRILKCFEGIVSRLNMCLTSQTYLVLLNFQPLVSLEDHYTK